MRGPHDGSADTSARPHVVIVGGGFGGVAAARALRDAPVRVTLVDRTNHYLFQPMLYQVATGLLSPSDIAMPTRFLFRRQANVEVQLAHVDHIDLERRLVAAQGDGWQAGYDYLVLAPGARHSYFGHPEWEPFAPGLKTLDDAREIRRRLLLAFEFAERSEDPVEQAALLTFVIVGGGPTGVELAGILPNLAAKGIRRDFRRIDPARARVILLEGGPRVLPTFPEALSERARRDLGDLRVEVRTGALVTRVLRDAVFVGDERIDTRTVFWAAGNAASPLVEATGLPVDRAGRALVGGDLSVPERPEVFVIGDAAAVQMPHADVAPGAPPAARPDYVPGLAAAANQMGAHAAAAIVASLHGRQRRAFRYRDKGALAIVGRNKAIADFGRVRLTGRLAFVTWLFVHLLYLVGFRNRVSVLLEWGYAYVTYRPGARLVSDETPARPAAGRPSP